MVVIIFDMNTHFAEALDIVAAREDYNRLNEQKQFVRFRLF